MSILTAAQVVKRANNANDIKRNWVELLRDAYEFALPMRNLYEVTQVGQQKMDRVFDSTAINSTQNFASTIQQGVTPPFTQFLDFLPGSAIPEGKKQAVIKKLQEIQKIFFEVIQNSNFDTAIAEFNLDLATGTGAMLVLEGDDDNPINHITVPNAQISLDEGAFGSVDGVFRDHDQPIRNIPLMWDDINETGLAALKKMQEKDESGKARLLEATYFDPDTNKYVYQIILRGSPKGGETLTSNPTNAAALDTSQPILLVEREMDEHPWIITRWVKVAGEVFGRGPILFALPDIKTVNKAKEFTLQRASFDVAGMWAAVDDGVMNPDVVEIFPGAIIPVAAVGNLQSLAPATNMDISILVINELQGAIKEALLDESLPSDQGPVRSPTEIVARLKQIQKKIGTPFARYMSEFLVPWSNRVLSILFRKALIDELPKVDGRIVSLKPTSPLAQQQNLDEIQNLIQLIEISKAMGQEAMMLGIKVEDVPAWIAEKLGVDQKLIRNKTEKQALQKMVGTLIAQQQQPQGAPATGQGQAATGI